MGISRRFFLGGAASLLSAPAIVRSESLMKLFVPTPEVLLPTQYVMETISLGFVVTQEAFEDNLYASWSARYSKALGAAMLKSAFVE